MKTARARFAIQSWDEKPVGEGDDLPKLTHATVAKTFTGDIEGEGRVEYVMTYRDDGSATFVGLERIVGTVGGRRGSFVLRRTGTFEGGVATESYSVVAGSGTGELAGLEGEGRSAVGHGMEHPFELSYELGDASRGTGGGSPGFVQDFHGVRYQVSDVARAVDFYTGKLGFELKHQQLPAFANVAFGELDLLLSGPGASGSRPMPDGQRQEPGGWSRIVLRVADLAAAIAALERDGVRFRNEMEVGPGGRQIQIEDPDGNPIELFEPARR